MQKKIKKFIVLTIGIIFILFGLLGLVLPFLQGIIFLVIGLILVSLCFPKARMWVNKHTQHHPRLFRIANKIEMWAEKFIGEM
ncbi:MAG: PGPGW domain-containing protein [Candidatus Paceibacterota bacterium]|jgi:uncharacterized membrane protein YbaN (DUF454 family)